MGKTGHGKQINQKFKSLLVLYFLMARTDENHFLTADALCELLRLYGINAERRSIYTDVDQLNKIIYIMENSRIGNPDEESVSDLPAGDLDDFVAIDEAEEDLEAYPEERRIKVKPKHGFYYDRLSSENTFDDYRILAESVYTAKFIDSGEVEKLIDIICSNVSVPQAEKIRHGVLNQDQSRTTNIETFVNVSIINDAMSSKLEGYPHEPEKISFKYVKHSINDMKQTVAKRGGDTVIVSPYKLIINDGNYYLRCFDDKNQRMQNYRVDRMKDVKRIGVPRDGKGVADKEDYKSYNQRVFGMYGGKKEYVSLKFTMSLLDTVVERFGKDKIKYHQIDAHHFSVMTEVETSPQFYAWLSGFGTSVEVVAPDNVRNEYRKHLKEILKKYE